jgi:hypothetical protein
VLLNNDEPKVTNFKMAVDLESADESFKDAGTGDAYTAP